MIQVKSRSQRVRGERKYTLHCFSPFLISSVVGIRHFGGNDSLLLLLHFFMICFASTAVLRLYFVTEGSKVGLSRFALLIVNRKGASHQATRRLSCKYCCRQAYYSM